MFADTVPVLLDGNEEVFREIVLDKEDGYE